MPVKINGSTSGSVTLAAPATGSDVTLTLPGTTATVATLANPTFTGNVVLPSTTTIGDGTTQGAWIAYTPTWNQLTVGNGTNAFYYTQIGKTVFVRGLFTFGSTSSMGTNPTFSLPVANRTAATSQNATWYGNAVYIDTGTAEYHGAVMWNSSTGVLLQALTVSGTYSATGTVQPTAPFTWTNGDKISVNFFYEAA